MRPVVLLLGLTLLGVTGCTSAPAGEPSSPPPPAPVVVSAEYDPFVKEGPLGTPIGVYQGGDMVVTVTESSAPKDFSLTNGRPIAQYDVTVSHSTRAPIFNPGYLWLLTDDGDSPDPIFPAGAIAPGPLAAGETRTGLLAFALDEGQQPATLVWSDGDTTQATWHIE